MKKIKVYLQYPWKISDSQYYKSLVENPPKNVEYVSQKTSMGMITNKNKLIFMNFIKKLVRKTFQKSGFVFANAHKTKSNEKYDLIHCAHCLSLNNTPWIADFESLWQMWVSGRFAKKGREKVLEILKKDSCKGIFAWTESGKKEIRKRFPEIKNKIDIIPYGMPYPKFKKLKSEKIRLLFIGRYFYEKGGVHALEVFDRLTKKYKNVEATFISEVPKKILKKYSKNKKIKIYGLIPYSKITNEIFPNSDVFVYPGYSDTFGFAFIEALAFGLPIVTVEGFSRKDIITEKKTGFIVKRGRNVKGYPQGNEEKRILKELTDKTSILIKNKKLREKMSKKCIKTIKEGKFSIKERNKKLEKIYKTALK